MKRWILAIGFLTTSGLRADPGPAFKLSAERPMMEISAIREASGLAVSRRDSGHYWVINDSGAAPEIHLVQANGVPRGKITLKDARNVDWEDLSAFEWNNESWLLVADTGDNQANREYCTIYVLREPALPKPGIQLHARLTSAWQIRFQYEGGPRDCEAVAVDAAAGKILLLSKRTAPLEVHELPLLKPAKRGTQMARRLGVTAVDAPLECGIPFRNQATAMDIAADQSFAAVATYYGVFVFRKSKTESWRDAFARDPVSLEPHLLAQAESVAVSKDGNRIVTISEGKKTPIVSYVTMPQP